MYEIKLGDVTELENFLTAPVGVRDIRGRRNPFGESAYGDGRRSRIRPGEVAAYYKLA